MSAIRMNIPVRWHFHLDGGSHSLGPTVERFDNGKDAVRHIAELYGVRQKDVAVWPAEQRGAWQI